MAIPHAAPGTIIDVRPFEPNSGDHHTQTLVKTGELEVVRLVLRAGKEIATHKAPGPLVVQCLEGRVEFTTMGKSLTMKPGQLCYLHPQEPHAVRAETNSSLLLTIVLPK